MKKTYPRLTSLLLLVFFFSGSASLIYQIVWQRLLTLYYGVGSISTTLIVSVYMFGLGVGSLLGGFLAERARRRITLYLVAKLLLGFFGLVSLPLLDLMGRHTAGSSYLVSSVYMFLFLSLPTLLMGVTLPLLTKILSRLTHDFVHTVSRLYFVNTLGAAIGAVFASYVVISFFGLDTGVYLAVAVDFILAAVIFLARGYSTALELEGHTSAIQERQDTRLGKIAYPLVFVTGFLAIGYEIIWFRVVGVLVGASPYVFSSVLSVYLLGVALGSLGMNRYLRRPRTVDRKSLFFFLQFLIGVYVMVAFGAYCYLTQHTSFGIYTRLSFSSCLLHPSLRTLQTFPFSVERFLGDLYCSVDVFLWSAVFMLVPTILMGASFPLVSSLALLKADQEGRTIGVVFFSNTMGNVLGGVITGFLILPRLGTEIALLVFSSVGILFALFVTRFADRQTSIVPKAGFALVLLALNAALFPRGGQLYETMHVSPGDEFEMYLEEGVDAIVVTYQHREQVRNFINGVGHGGRPGYAYYFETAEAVAFAPKVESVLIIGYGTGSITEAVLKLEDVQRVTVVELSSTLMKNLKKMPIFEEMIADSRLNLVIDDGRRFLLRTPETFDLILMDPLRTTTSHSNNLYSHEFFELANWHLNRGGILLVWMDEHKVVPKTILSAFDHLRVYDFFCLASDRPFEWNDERQSTLMASFSPQDREGILTSRGEYVGDQFYVEEVTERYPINEDWKPVCEFYLGLRVKEAFLLRE